MTTDRPAPDSISRRDLGAVAAKLFPAPWSASLAQALGWNPRTVERLGTPRMPLDKRRATLAAEMLERAEHHTDAAAELSAWLKERISTL